MPCLDRFARQDRRLPGRRCSRPSVRARVSVEAAATLGWDRWVGDAGEAIGMTGFGASAPAKALYEHFGFAPEAGRRQRTSRPEDHKERLMSVETSVNPRLAALAAAGTSALAGPDPPQR